jgi:nucleoside-diphosphate-sugar epimerase
VKRLPSAKRSEGVLVTGSAGFVGSHVCDALVATSDDAALHGLDVNAARPSQKHPSLRMDIRKLAALRRAATSLSPAAVVHLAARAEVVVPFRELGELLATNVDGTLHVLEAFKPSRVVFASSCAVYGDVEAGDAPASWDGVRPVGAYGMSKAAGELVCRDWARETGGVAVRLRFGNVIGPRCRGLIPYLVAHARRHPDGSVPASLRGNGRIVRDYVPVEHVVATVQAALAHAYPAGASPIYNVGSGRGLTNREVAGIVKRVLAEEGFALRMDFRNPVAIGEAQRAVLDVRGTTRAFGLKPPSPADVVAAIEGATRAWLGVDPPARRRPARGRERPGARSRA